MANNFIDSSPFRSHNYNSLARDRGKKDIIFVKKGSDLAKTAAKYVSLNIVSVDVAWLNGFGCWSGNVEALGGGPLTSTFAQIPLTTSDLQADV